ncbi:Protein of unknown function [Gryllus bimaculatus]|nr:Protein of unknown function [Gryllus bimaculatus]
MRTWSPPSSRSWRAHRQACPSADEEVPAVAAAAAAALVQVRRPGRRGGAGMAPHGDAKLSTLFLAAVFRKRDGLLQLLPWGAALESFPRSLRAASRRTAGHTCPLTLCAHPSVSA